MLAAVALWALLRPVPRRPGGAGDSHAYGLVWLVLVVQNVIAQLVTGPLTRWNEAAFSLYYLLLFVISATVVFHFQALRERGR